MKLETVEKWTKGLPPQNLTNIRGYQISKLVVILKRKGGNEGKKVK